ncbi:MAG: Vps62-related protein [Leptospirales bacterium]|jgi:hypothetical protein
MRNSRFSSAGTRPARTLPLLLALAYALSVHCAAGADDSEAGLAGFITNETSALSALLLNAATASGVDYDQDMIDDSYENWLMRKFAPTLYVHPSETSVPASVGWMLSQGGAQMKHNSDNLCTDNLLLDWGQMTAKNMGTQTTRGKGGLFCKNTSTRYYSYRDYPEDKEFYLRVAERVYPGNINTAKCYARVGISTKSSTQIKYEIEYWWFYTYNPAVPFVSTAASGKGGQHQGDWEHVRVFVTPDERVHSVAYANHGDPTVYAASDSRLNLQGGYRPDVYSARYSHASYPDEGSHWRALWGGIAFSNDKTKKDPGGGNIVNCAAGSRLVNVGNSRHMTPGNEWIKYRGAWGTKKDLLDWVGHFRADPGPTGPRMTGIDWNVQASISGPGTVNFAAGTATEKDLTYDFSPRLATKLGSVTITSVSLSDRIGASFSRSDNRITVRLRKRSDVPYATYALRVNYSVPLDGSPGQRKTLSRTKNINVYYGSSGGGCDSSVAGERQIRDCPIEIEL